MRVIPCTEVPVLQPGIRYVLTRACMQCGQALAFGSFLRDVETHVDTEYALLTPAPNVRPPPMLGQ